MNIVLLITIALLLLKIWDGYNRGMVKEIISMISLMVACIIVVIVGAGLYFVKYSEIVGLLVVVLLFALLGIIHHFLRLVFLSAKLISQLPVISLGNKILGTVVGALEVLLLLWTVNTLSIYCNLGVVGDVIIEGCKDSVVLSKVCSYNFIIPIVENVLAKLPW